MIKRILGYCLTILIVAYLIIAITRFNHQPEGVVCKQIELCIKDSVDRGFVTLPGVKNLLKHKGLLPVGKPVKEINVHAIEQALKQHPFIRKADCYLTSGGNLKIIAHQRIPLLRIMADNGDNYYLDSDGKTMSATGTSVYVPVATGFIDRKYAKTKLYDIALCIEQNPFWKAQIEQINITPRLEVQMVPRIGNQILFFGKADDIRQQFERLKIFYAEALNRVGWNKYSRISVEFNNQIICTKNDNN